MPCGLETKTKDKTEGILDRDRLRIYVFDQIRKTKAEIVPTKDQA